MGKSFSGLGVALITPFNNREIDYNAYANIIEYVIEGGIDFLVPLGSTGEAATIDWSEQQSILQFVVEQTKTRVPIMAGCFGGNDSYRLARKIRDFNLDGIDGLLSASPEYSKPTQEGIFRHYEYLNGVSHKPIMVYNVPGRTASNITAATTIRISKLNMICGVKEASADLQQTKQIIDHAIDFTVNSGDDPTAMDSILMGADGLISVAANVYPNLFKSLVSFAQSSELAKAKTYNDLLNPIHKWMYIEGNPTGVKMAASIKSLCRPEMRLPLLNLSAESTEKLKSCMCEIDQQIS